MRSLFRKRVIVLVVLVLLLIGAAPRTLKYYRYFLTHVSTDDAYVDGNIDLIAARVSGTVSKLYVNDNWIIKAGDPLVELDPRDFEVRVQQAQAQLERARETVDQLFSQLSVAQAGVELAASQLMQARLDYQRAKSLHASRVVSQQDYDRATTALGQAEANKILAEQEVGRARAALGGTPENRPRYARAIVEQAQAALRAVQLDLSYTKLVAPVSGIVTHKSVQLGHRIQVGQPLMSLVPVNSLYITANYKETQLTDVRVGQTVDVEADIYPGHSYHGRVDSISFGTGAAFSLLPPENATGNWVKVVQRVPVKIVLDGPMPPNKQLRLGLSVEVAIDISDTSGPLLASTLQQQHRLDGTAPAFTQPALQADTAPQVSEPSVRR